MKVKALNFTKNHGFHGNTEMGFFNGRRPISWKMSRPCNRELGWSLIVTHWSKITNFYIPPVFSAIAGVTLSEFREDV